MKKRTYIVWGMLLAFIISCSNETDQKSSNNEKKQNVIQSVSNKRTYQEALEIAQNSLSILEKGDGVTRKSSNRRIIDKNPIIVGSKHNQMRSATGSIDTLLYVFNFINDNGFAVISASKDTESILAITENGHYSVNEQSEIEGLNIFMDLAKNYVMMSHPPFNPRPPYDYTDIKDSIAVHESYTGPFVTVQWGQHDPEGNYCSNHISGCTITAMAQVMSYYEYPTSINLTYEGADLTTQILDWTDMKKHVTNYNHYSCLASQDAHNAIGRLCRQLGEISNSDYTSPIETRTSSLNAKITLQLLGFQTSGWNDYNTTSLIGNMYQNRAVLMIGSRIKENNELASHMWVLDRLLTRTTEVFTWSKGVLDLEWNLVYYNTFTSHYFHFNWGYNGANNGYFCENVFNTSNVIDPDTNMNNIDRDYNINVKYLAVYHE